MLETNFLMFFLPILSIVLGLLLWTAYKTGGHLSKYLKTTGKQVLFGLIMAVCVPALVGLVLTVIAYGNKVEAAEVSDWRYLDHSIIVAGLEVPAFTSNPFCHDNGVSDKLTSNLAFYQQLAGKQNVDYYFHYLHHSCALNMDKPTYDAFGLSIHWRIDWNNK